MKTLALSVVPQDVGCNAKCKFCISESTFKPDTPVRAVDYCVLDRACRFAKDCGAQTGIITGKGEPLLMEMDRVQKVVNVMSEHFAQIDIHTNGKRIIELNRMGILSGLHDTGLTNITLSIAHYSMEHNGRLMGFEPYDVAKTIQILKDIGFHVRLSCVLAKSYIDSFEEIEQFLDFAHDSGADAVIFRELWVAGVDCPEKDWCKTHYVPLSLWGDFAKRKDLRRIMDLPWGGVYDYCGMAVSASECEYRQVEFVKSLILLPDNHVYSSWASEASKLW